MEISNTATDIDPGNGPDPSVDAMEEKIRNTRLFKENFASRASIVSNRPLEFFVESSNACNLRCLMCNLSHNEDVKETPPVSLELIDRVTDFYPGLLQAHLHGVGEPLLNRNLTEIIRRIRRAGGPVVVDFFTNAMLLDRSVSEALVDAGVDRIVFSIDGATKETYEAIHRGARWERLLKNLDGLNGVKRERGSEYPRLQLNLIAMNMNFHEFPELVALAAGKGIGRIEVKNLVVAAKAPDEIRRQKRHYDPERDDAVLAEAKEIADRNGVELVLDYYRSSRVPSGPAAPARDVDRNPCFQPWKTFYVKSNGEVKPCCFTGRTMGSLLESTPEEIWNGPGYRRLRESIARGVYPEGCATCVKFDLRPRADDSDSWLSVIAEKQDRRRPKFSCVPTARPKEELLDSGEEQFSRGDIASAMKTFLRVLEIDRTDPRALNNLGVIQWQVGDAVAAMETFQVALSFHPECPDALTNLLKAAEETGRLDLLRPELLEALEEAHPGNPDLARVASRAPGRDFLLKPGVSIRAEGRVRIDAEWKPVGVTDQFLENAETYHSRYFGNGFGKGNFRNSVVARALDIARVDREAPLRVLDIGSGSGNTVFAAAELLPNSVIFANDISPRLLQILVRFQERVPALEGRIHAYCFDLHKDFFVDESFDLVHGNAILHHLLDPEAALRNVARWVRPGGKILLAEPMEAGGHMLAAVYLTLLSELEEEADPRIAGLFKALCADYEARFGIPRAKPWTPDLDDKWFFHASFLRRMAANLGLTLETIAPTVPDLRNLFRDTVHGHIAAAGLADVPVPARMREILERFDAGVLPGLKKLFAPAGIIVLAKPEGRA